MVSHRKRMCKKAAFINCLHDKLSNLSHFSTLQPGYKNKPGKFFIASNEIFPQKTIKQHCQRLPRKKSIIMALDVRDSNS